MLRTSGPAGSGPAPHPCCCRYVLCCDCPAARGARAVQVLPLTRVKKLIKAEIDVKMASSEAIFLIGRATVRSPTPGIQDTGWRLSCVWRVMYSKGAAAHMANSY